MSKASKPPITIVVLPHSWVLVGRFEVQKDTVILSDASVIRKWGTTDGLGQIALHGPTKNTKLDKCGTVRILRRGVVFAMDCAQEVWEAHCG